MNNMSREKPPENAGQMQASGKFQKGQSGILAERQKGQKIELQLLQNIFYKLIWITFV